MHLGINIKVARIAKKLSQQELADKIGKTRPLISHIEQTGKVNHATLKKISQALNISIESIEAMVNEPNEKNKGKDEALKEVVKENERLIKENTMLKELVKSQKETISLLKHKKPAKARQKHKG